MKLFLNDLDLEKSELANSIRRITVKLHNHSLYKSIKTIDDVRTYMEYQVWCVWDFMALLKALQKGLLKNDIEWVPKLDASIGAYLYEILLTEETDINDTAGHSSHFETYVRAMEQAGANTQPINDFIANLRRGKKFDEAIKGIEIPAPAFEFVQNTLKHAHSEIHKVVSVFCLSREGIIPGMFTTLLRNSDWNHNLSTFRWYLNRHIEVDSDKHGPLSVKLFNVVVGRDEQTLIEALYAAFDALNARKKFLDSILSHISSTSKKISK